MMNKFQDLMNDSVPVQLVVDAITDRAHHKVIKGTIKHVGRNYLEVGRVATGDEATQFGAEEVRVMVPIEKIAEVIYSKSE
ncbi:MAG: hypothetical protein ACW98J_09420 [Candidatus Thorarchaeota archaeon]|jgi:hypothetical protein